MGKKLLLLGLMFLFVCSPAIAKEIYIGALADETGATSEVGRDAARGVKECVQYLNDKGGINGNKIKLNLKDYKYDKQLAVQFYKEFKDGKIDMLLQWGTADTEALAATVTQDKMVTISDSLSGHLCNPAAVPNNPTGHPYNFIYSTDYSTNARACLTAWFEEVWKKSDKWKAAREAGKKPKLVCFFQKGCAYCEAPLKAIKDQAAILGIEVGNDQSVGLKDVDATSQVLAAKNENPSVVWHGNTVDSVVTVVKDAFANALGADHISNNWGFSQSLLDRTGEAGEGVIGAAPVAFFGEDVPLMKEVMEYAAKIHPSEKKRDVHTCQGWLKVGMAAAALTEATKKGELNGPDLKAAFESFKDWTVFGIPNALGRPPYTITDKDHRPSGVALIYHIKDKKIQLLKKMDMKTQFKDKWESWLGW